MNIDDWHDALFHEEDYGGDYNSIVPKNIPRESRDMRAVFQYLQQLPQHVSPFNHPLTKVCEDCSLAFRDMSGLRISNAIIASECQLCTILQSAAQPGNPMQFSLLRAWLSSCDKFHECNESWTMLSTVDPDKLLEISPTRLVDVGLSNQGTLRLFCPKDATPLKYAALSHYWGNLSQEEQRRYCTTDEHCESRKCSFPLAELPKTFRDAICVTRELGLRYLWVDSLCIIQGNARDWEQEARRMEYVYKCAYVTLAATSAFNSNDGFLHASDVNENCESQPGVSPLGKSFYSTFLREVQSAQLNYRAWVLQEKILSRRTIHFGRDHIYFECGQGVCNDSLLTMSFPPWSERYFFLDPDFPGRLVEAGHQKLAEFIHTLYEDFAACELTYKTDRRVAIASLEASIADSKEIKGVYGVFDRYLHRDLLWARSDRDTMEQINYDSCAVPSWSWMAYHGGIKYFEIPHNDEGITWATNLHLSENVANSLESSYTKEATYLVTDVGTFVACISEQNGADCDIYDVDASKEQDSSHLTLIGSVWYDTATTYDLAAQRCVVVARRSFLQSAVPSRFYILVVTPTGMPQQYRRVGAGWIGCAHVAREKENVRIV